MVKNYYNLTEAAQHLTEEIGEQISENDVINLAARKYFNLCLLLKTCMAARFNLYDKTDDVIIERFTGLVIIPSELCMFNYGESPELTQLPKVKEVYGSKESQRIFDPKYPYVIARLKDQKKYKGKITFLTAEDGFKLNFDPIYIESQNIRIPTQELCAYIQTKVKTAQTTIPRNLKTIILNSKKRINLLDEIIIQAIEKANSLKAADVFAELREFALAEKLPFDGTLGDAALGYTNDKNEKKELTKNAVGKRLARIQKAIRERR